MAKIYTKSGDDGSTGLADGTRVHKDDVIIAAVGGLDEINAAIGLCRTQMDDYAQHALHQIQVDLISIGSIVAKHGNSSLRSTSIEWLENLIDENEHHLRTLTNFIVFGGCELAARLHMARTICRRAERDIIVATDDQDSKIYINRLSDLFFVMARKANADHEISDYIA